MNTLKKITTIVFIAASTLTFSQVNLGVKGGFNTGNFTLDREGFDEIVSGENILGFETGVFVNFQSNNAYFRPEILYTFRKGEAELPENGRITVHRVEVPLMVGVQFFGPLAIEAGPTYHHTVLFESGFEGDVDIKRNAFGYRIGPALHFDKISAYANFQGFAFAAGRGTEFKEPYRINAGLAYRFGR